MSKKSEINKIILGCKNICSYDKKCLIKCFTSYLTEEEKQEIKKVVSKSIFEEGKELKEEGEENEARNNTSEEDKILSGE